MATILLSAAGAAIGAGFGGTILGLSGAVIGRAVGATLGRAIDQQLLGGGSGSVETGRVDRLRLTSASEGDGLGLHWGRMRVAGQVIWATRFIETKHKSGGGKGEPTFIEYSYSVSLAMALGEGEILRVGRIWADGTELDPSDLNMRVYTGSEDQQPDPKIEAVEGAGAVPSYRGIAYVVFENLQLKPFGNRVPQFTFEVVRPAQGKGVRGAPDLTQTIEAVALIPGTGEYSLATRRVSEAELRGDGTGSDLMYPTGSSLSFFSGWGIDTAAEPVNQHAPHGGTDFAASVEMLDEELPGCGAVSLVVSWFGDDLRCDRCQVRPKVGDRGREGREMRWCVSGAERRDVDEVPKLDGHSIYGGTPADAAVIEAIAALHAAGKAVTFYPFILMDQLEGNALPDPWSDARSQPKLPWRGRITTSEAPGRAGSPDGAAAAVDEVVTFFGAAQVTDFAASGETVTYSGPEEWSFRRFILHYAHLCKLAGGVEAFCIGSEMRSLTQIRRPGNSFPAVAQLVQLARDVRAVLGAECKIGHAADWTEYFGYQPGNGDRFFHLDPLWADDDIDFIGIDNYMPLSDWREGEHHADAHWGTIYDLDYLQSNVEGGEGFDWYYASPEHRDAQIRTQITDGDHGEPWVWRYKDIRGWWEHDHHERIGGVRIEEPTAWVPRSKPIWFTEMGCAAIDKGTNEPNKFLDPKSSESALPHYSDGRRDDYMQMQYLRAMTSYWGDDARNPVSEFYGGPMVDMSHAHVWAWDVRPYPQFPGLPDLWEDAANYARGHWISGRATAQPLAHVVGEICALAGVSVFDVSALHGVVRGYAMPGGITPRGALQSLSLIYGFDAVERDGVLVFRMRDASVDAELLPPLLALDGEDQSLETRRVPEAEIAGRVRLAYVEADGSFETRAVEAIFPDEMDGPASASEAPLALTRAEGIRVVHRWLAEARVARDTVQFTLPPSMGWLGPGDVVVLQTEEGALRYRIDRMERAEAIRVEAVRAESGIYDPSEETDEVARIGSFTPPVPVTPVFLDLPLLTGAEDPYAPHLAVTASPWPGAAALYSALEDAGYALNTKVETQAAVGVTQAILPRAQSGLWDRGPGLRVKMLSGELHSASEASVLAGLNAMAIGDGSSDRWEIFQFVTAEPVEPGVWDISTRLRGQAGSDAVMPDAWPEGSVVVMLDGALRQIEVAPSARNLARHYRVGPAGRGYDDPSYIHTVQAFAGIGLRPLSPCHLRAGAQGGDLRLSWVRRTRIGGDDWEALDVPLGEASERYRVRVLEGQTIRREVIVSTPEWTYGAAERAEDGMIAAPTFEVAQISDVFGPGLPARLIWTG
ncbi:host specificity protein [Thioclava sp. F42-5]|uniref:baseplate multidomain protein megatron n=1 Tax=Thioclava sp. F42-5 TaxID=1973005 RepID=UPI000B53BE75|nr:glycoside hydrolase/phage tail family protein [Thioclava sp. F42-5]OWY08025.1 host specificity protein [Thioclava sp. F42-5]